MNKEYQSYLRSDDWKEKKAKKYRAVKKNRCAICASTEKLDVHHLNYRNLYDVETSDLRVLCRRCHFLTHELFKKGKIKFKNTNHNSRFAFIKNAIKKKLKIHGINMFRRRQETPKKFKKNMPVCSSCNDQLWLRRSIKEGFEHTCILCNQILLLPHKRDRKKISL